VPWHNKIVVGTTDRNEKHSIEPIALETEIEFVLETAQRYLVKTHTGRCFLFFAGYDHWQRQMNPEKH
jgi:glycerol-3-phosphate dehydrogenase